MAETKLFPREQPVIGVFRGLQQSGMEFRAELVLPYRSELHNIPVHGRFLLIQLETPDVALLGRISSLSAEGKLSFGSGEEFSIRAVQENRPIPEEIREQHIKYRVNIRTLGVLRQKGDKLVFVPSHRRLPQVGNKIVFPSDEVLQYIAGHDGVGQSIGQLAFGEYIYTGDSAGKIEDWMQPLPLEVNVKFPIDSLVSRRSFIFARAGFGKSNLNKLLFSKLYEHTPCVTKGGGKQVPVGTVIFDPDGEYFWPDDKDRPGLCDVPALEDKLVLFTARKTTSAFYRSFIAGGIKLDIRKLRPDDVISIALNPERQENQNVQKLRGLSQGKWEKLVDLIDAERNDAELKEICTLLRLEARQQVEALAARSNMTGIVEMLHSPNSQLMDMLIHALSQGKICIVDISQMRERRSLIFSGLILRRIFERNQEQFTAAEPSTIPTIAVIEEAQSVLGEDTNNYSREPYVTWVKEGRKYDLGAMLITQQPGSIPRTILSQGDNWFIFHLLSAGDLTSLQRANSHFSDDLLRALMNEPIPGHCVFWSSSAGKAYPINMRVFSFEDSCSVRDPDYKLPAGKTYALQLRKKFESTWRVGRPAASAPAGPEAETAESVDVKMITEQTAIKKLAEDKKLMGKLASEEGVAWGKLKADLKELLPDFLDDRDHWAYSLVVKFLNHIVDEGEQYQAWDHYRKPPKKGTKKGITYVCLKKNNEEPQ